MVMLVIKSEDNMLAIVQSLVTLLVLYKSAAFLNQFTESRLRVRYVTFNGKRFQSPLYSQFVLILWLELWSVLNNDLIRSYSCAVFSGFISGLKTTLKIVELKFIWILIFECNFNWNHWAWNVDWSLLFHA